MHLNSKQIEEINKRLEALGFPISHKKEEKKETLIRPRKGKTQKDLESGAKARNRKNIEERAAWQSECNGNREVPFPYHTCNGKKNRYRVTGKEGASIIIKR